MPKFMPILQHLWQRKTGGEFHSAFLQGSSSTPYLGDYKLSMLTVLRFVSLGFFWGGGGGVYDHHKHEKHSRGLKYTLTQN